MGPTNRRQKLYQLVISRLDGAHISSGPYQDGIRSLVQKGVGGFIVFGGERDEVRSFIGSLQSAADIPLFIASDIERGVGQQIAGTTGFPPQMAIASAIHKFGDEDLRMLEDMVRAVADEAADIGMNMPYIPVLDVNSNPDNPIICTRAFSDRPEKVARYGDIYIKVIEGAGLISCAKHFPGHGDTSVDSHIDLPVITKSRDALISFEVLPFKSAIRAGVSSIMMGHLSIPSIDSVPASLSHSVITGMLRGELGFDGLVLTDALNMDALKEIAGVPVKCLNAGVDIILHPADTDGVVDELEAALDRGALEEARVDRAVERVLKYKSKIRSMRTSGIDYTKHTDLAGQLSDRSIALVKDSTGIVPVKNLDQVHLIFSGDPQKHDLSPLKRITPGPVSVKDAVLGPIDRPVVIAVFTTVAAWKGSSGIDPEEIGAIKKIIKRAGRSILVSFGSPYVLRHFGEADILIAAYDPSPRAQHAVMRCLRGEMGFTGRLPVDLHLL